MSGQPASTVTPETLFQAASISKSLTAMAALELVEQGKLSLDVSVQTELKSWTLPQSSFTSQAPVTLRELLSHTAGTSVHGFEGYTAGQTVPTLIQVLNGSKPANSAPIVVEQTPGKKFSYSGGGYTIVQQMMVDQTGKQFPDLMSDLVLKPIGMKSSTFQQPLGRPTIDKIAFPFNAEGNALPGGPHTYPEMAAAGLWTTPSDLALWVIEMQRSLQGRANHVLSVDFTRRMLTPVERGYALGTGVHFAYQTGEGAVIMTNSNSGSALFGEILGSIAGEYHWADFLPEERTIASVPLAQQLKFTGKFRVTHGPGIEITANDNSLLLSIDGRKPQTLFPSSADYFFVIEDTLQLSFSGPDAGALMFGSHKNSFQRVKNTPKL